MWTSDLRPWGAGRYTILRDPKHARWPAQGRLAASQPEAARWSLHYLSQPELEVLPSGTLGSTIAAFLAARKSGNYNTYKHLRAVLARVERAYRRDIPLAAIDASIYFEKARREGLRASTLESHRQVFKAFMRWAGYPDALRGVWMPRGGREAPMTLMEWQVEAQVRAAPEPMATAIAVAYATGVRVSELLALRWEDFDGDIVRVERQLTDARRTVPTKGKEARTTFVLPTFRPEAGRSGWVVPHADRGPMLHATFYRALKEAKGDCHCHIYRHSYARSFLARPGTSLHMLQAMLGHKHYRTVEQYYKHFTASDAVKLARSAFLAPEAAQAS